MPTTAPHALGPAADVLITPAYLAGPGTDDAIFNNLDSATGWTKVVAFGEDTYYTSPCQRVRIANVMDSHYGGWTISYAEDPLGVPDWITTFDRDTPREIVAAFTDTLVAGLPNNFANYLSGGTHYTGHTPATVLSSHHWEAVRGTRPFRMVSPDGHAAYRIRGGWLHEYDELLDPENLAHVRRPRPHLQAQLAGVLQPGHPRAPHHRLGRGAHRPDARDPRGRPHPRSSPLPGGDPARAAQPHSAHRSGTGTQPTHRVDTASPAPGRRSHSPRASRHRLAPSALTFPSRTLESRHAHPRSRRGRLRLTGLPRRLHLQW
ncbi:hypothetical protein GCM10010211_37370 [Streptomyces albospinus]|uniref:DUF317 domain-containing protein n=1 Tax=Streptomyces albospinus TaxID=285515 RepID=A0ABQ2V6H8_9ACTN|nr:hypothetical protein GCM10010211_37370 [Streptomyces albospinus]